MNSYIQKYLSTAALFIAAMAWAGCDGLLTEQVVSGITAERHFSTPRGFEDAVIAAYNPIRIYYGAEAGYVMSEIGTDLWRDGRLTESWYSTYSAGLNPTSPFIEDIWRANYVGINNTNAVISRADHVPGLREDVKNQRVAEARFLRAQYYFILVQHFGPVHLTLEETIGVETEANRTPEAEIYQAILADLQFAVTHLPDVQGDWGRPTKNAARHSLAKVHLVLQNWQQAADNALAVIGSGQHRLMDNYADVHDHDNERNDEIIWAVQHTYDPLAKQTGIGGINSEGGFNWGHLGFLARYDQLPGMVRDLENGRPFSRIMPTDYMLTELFGNDYRQEGLHIRNDTRYHASFNEVFYYNNAATIPFPNAAVGDTAAWFTTDPYVQEMTAEQKAARPYRLLAVNDFVTQWYPSLTKQRDQKRAHFQDSQGGRDVIVMRLAETHLIAAEALMMLGRMGDALQHFNTVRQRAAYPGQPIPLATHLDIDEILDERGRELVGEHMRWTDLKRTGKLLERVRLHNSRGAANIQEHHMLRPIPQSQVDRTTNAYEQNPGY